MSFSAKQKLDAVDREVKLMVRIYTRLIERGEITAELANRELAILREVADDYFKQTVHDERLL